MNRGLLLKALRETWPATLLFALALFFVEFALSYVLPRFQHQLSEQWLQVAFVQSIIKAMVGADLAGNAGPDIFLAIPWVHPVVLAITWAHAIVFCTRIPAGEVDRGTIDVLLSLPVSRWQLHTSDTAAWLFSSVFLLAAATAGNSIGSTLSGAPWHAARVNLILTNLAALYLSVGAFAWLLSACCDRRGKAIAAAFIVVIASFLLNYLAQFWRPAESVAFLSLLRYYRPLPIMQSGQASWPDVLVLGALAAACWTAAGIVSARRDLTTT